ncbi:MAG: CapA family protein [Coriobacteriales bacterium]|nr:CapA family protein [Coriobacteriales bacterium]
MPRGAWMALAAATVLLVVSAAFGVTGALRAEEEGFNPNGPSSGSGGATSTAGQSETAEKAAADASGTARAAASAEPTGPAVVEIGWVGDLTPGSKYGNPPRRGRALLEPTRRYLRQPDLMVGNLEGTFGDGGPSKSDGSDSGASFSFQAPPENAEALKWAGFDVMNIANNHSNDYFERGLKATKQALKTNRISHTGMPDQITVREANGVRVAFVGFSPYPWSADIGDISEAKRLVKRADKQADVVVVLMHAGAEGAEKTHTPKGAEYAYGEFRGETRRFAHGVIDAGADLVLGSGPHVVRGMEHYKDRLVAYSLANFAGWDNFNLSGDLALSGLLTVKVDAEGNVLGGRWLSLRLAEPGVPKVDSDHEAAQAVRRLSREDFGERAVDLDDDGRFGEQ